MEENINDNQIKDSVELKIEVDRTTLQVVGSKNPTLNIEGQKLQIKILDSIKNTLNNLTSWIIDFNKLSNNGQHDEAYSLFEEKKSFLFFKKDEDILTSLLQFDNSRLNNIQRENIVFYTILYAAFMNNFGRIEQTINNYLIDFESTLDIKKIASIYLIKANSLAQNKKYGSAQSYYTKVINNTNTSTDDIAWAYMGLSNISLSIEDTIKYRKLAIDKFLECGNKTEAIGTLLHLSTNYQTFSVEMAIEAIDKAIALYEGNSSIEKEYLAGIYHRKATYLNFLKKYTESLLSIEKACELREHLIGKEHERYASYQLARITALALGDSNKSDDYLKKIEAIIPLINTDEFKLQEELVKAFKTPTIENSLILKIEKSNYGNIKLAMYLHIANDDNSTIEQKTEWLDKCNLLINNGEFTNQEKCVVNFTYAEVYRKEKLFDLAYNKYETALQFDPFYFSARQNYAATLWSNHEWDRAKYFFKNQIEIHGEMPNLCYAYGRSLFECGNIQEAYNYFIKAKNNGITGVDINSFILKCTENNNTLFVSQEVPGNNQIEAPITIEIFKNALEDFSKSISTSSRMQFWKNQSGKYKWSNSPEELAKHHLITGLETRFSKGAIEIIQERPVGAGKIDLYILLRGGTKIVLELKMCGGGYSSSYAISGEDQLLHYINNVETKLGFLIVFDGRKRDFSKGLKSFQSIGNITLHTLAIDIRPKVK